MPRRLHLWTALLLVVGSQSACIVVSTHRPPAQPPAFAPAAGPLLGTFHNQPVEWGVGSLLQVVTPSAGSCIPGRSCQDESKYLAVRLHEASDTLHIAAWAPSDSSVDTLRYRLAITGRRDDPRLLELRRKPKLMGAVLFGFSVGRDGGSATIGLDDEGRLLVHAQRRMWATGVLLMPFWMRENWSAVGVYAPLPRQGDADAP